MVERKRTNEICLTRVYDAPVKMVWDAWTDPDQVSKWWGPRGFTLTTHSKGLCKGGIWHYTMHGPDGTDYPNKTLYHEVEACKKLVYDHGGYDDRPPLFRVTVVFVEVDGKTKMEMTAVCPSAEEAATMRKFIQAAGGNTTWDRLAEYLDETNQARNCFVVTRSFEAPIDQLFDMWTDPVHFSHWLPPVGFDMDFLREELRVGGNCFFRMTNGAGVTFYGQLEYRDIQRPSRIVYIQRFCDEHEKLACHPGLPVFPQALLVTVAFASEYDQSTRVTVTTEPLGAASSEEIAAFVDLRSSMSQGWTGSFDKLELLVASDEKA